MKKLLIISFDFIKSGECNKSLAVSSIITFLQNHSRYGFDFIVEHISIDMFNLGNKSTVDDLNQYIEKINFETFDFIALSAYVWNEYLTNNLIKHIRDRFNFHGDFIIGGYQISYSSFPELEYPDCKYFISGYAEQSILDILLNPESSRKLSSKIDFNTLPSPYLSNVLTIKQNQKMVRLETKRGCPYRCSFCAHRDLTFNKVYKHNIEKVFQEISLFEELKVQKINIVDPIFNAGKDYLMVLQEMKRVKLKALISMQTRFETIVGTKGNQFLDYCGDLNVNLEFGLQTAIFEESLSINRKNNPEKIKIVLNELKNRGIPYEISLIYGLPHQTVDSFKSSIDFVLDNGCVNLTAFPLMLLKGTELYSQKEKFGMKESTIGEYNIPVVTSSQSFSEKDWYDMQFIANNLSVNSRIM